MLYIAAYDTEAESCLAGVRRIVEMHEKHGLPATFFIVAKLLEGQGQEYRALLGGNPLFEIASHSYSHVLLRDHAMGGPGAPAEELPGEIIESKKALEDLFGREVKGLRTPWGYPDGLRGAREALRLCHEAGYRYCSSLLWGPDYSMPSLFVEPFTYAEDGYADLWEIPASGWQDNLLKHGGERPPWRLQLFPSPMPEAVLTRRLETPEEEFALNRLFIDKGEETAAGHVSLIWHPWSLHRFDPEMRMLDLTFAYVRELGLRADTFSGYADSLASAREGCAASGDG